MILKVAYTFTNPNNVHVKKIGPLLDMLHISLGGDKTFPSEKGHRSRVTLKVQYTLRKPKTRAVALVV